MKKIGVAATLAILSLVPTGCVNLEALRQLSDPQTVSSQTETSQSSKIDLIERIDKPAVPATTSLDQVCRKYKRNMREEQKLLGELYTVPATASYIHPGMPDYFEFGLNLDDGTPNRYHTRVYTKLVGENFIEYKDFSNSTAYEVGLKYTLTGQLVRIRYDGSRCTFILSNGYKYRLSSKAF